MLDKINILFPKKRGTIAPEIYGHFTEHIGGVIYDGIYVGKGHKCADENGFRKYITEKLRSINAPVIRWPGGCYAEVYDWRDGIGENRPTRLSWWTKHDGKYESNEVGTHEFMAFCESVGAKPYFAVNVTSSTPMDAVRWMDYCLSEPGTTSLALEREKNGRKEPFDIPYFGVGNENWGGGGNMRPEYYADIYRQYSQLMDYMPFTTALIAGGANGADYNWTHKFCESMENSTKHIYGYSLHYYTGFMNENDDPVAFSRENWYNLLYEAFGIEDLMERHWGIIKGRGLEDKCRFVIDEWGAWHKEGTGPSKGKNLFEQQSSVRDAMLAAITLNIFNNHCEKILMANIAQLVNNIHCLFLSEDDKCITTPTYHVFDMYKSHQGGKLIETAVECDDIEFGESKKIKSLSVSASLKDSTVTLTIANVSADEDKEVEIASFGVVASDNLELAILSHEDYHAHNTFENPDNVKLRYEKVKGNVVTVPKAGIVTVKYDINK